MNVNELDLTQAARAYGVANTPPFLVRKLQGDPAVRQLGATGSAEEILRALRSAASVEPNSAVEAVRPYALLVALWFAPTIDSLQDARKIPATAYRWYDYVAQLLIETFSPVQRETMQVPGLLSAPSISVGSSVSVTNPKIVIALR
jgi:hypothetical protein